MSSLFIFLVCYFYYVDSISFQSCKIAASISFLPKTTQKEGKGLAKGLSSWAGLDPKSLVQVGKKKKHKEHLGLISFGFTFSLFYTSTLIRNHPTNQNKAKQNQIIKFVYLVSKVNCVWTKAWRSASNHWGNLLKMLFPESHLNPF